MSTPATVVRGRQQQNQEGTVNNDNNNRIENLTSEGKKMQVEISYIHGQKKYIIDGTPVDFTPETMKRLDNAIASKDRVALQKAFAAVEVEQIAMAVKLKLIDPSIMTKQFDSIRGKYSLADLLKDGKLDDRELRILTFTPTGRQTWDHEAVETQRAGKQFMLELVERELGAKKIMIEGKAFTNDKGTCPDQISWNVMQLFKLLKSFTPTDTSTKIEIAPQPGKAFVLHSTTAPAAPQASPVVPISAEEKITSYCHEYLNGEKINDYQKVNDFFLILPSFLCTPKFIDDCVRCISGGSGLDPDKVRSIANEALKKGGH